MVPYPSEVFLADLMGLPYDANGLRDTVTR
jgi:hypothetical protein